MSERSSENTPGTFRVAALQMVSAPDRERNIAQAGRLIAEAARDGAQLVLLPEEGAPMREQGQVRPPKVARQARVQESKALELLTSLRLHSKIRGELVQTPQLPPRYFRPDRKPD